MSVNGAPPEVLAGRASKLMVCGVPLDMMEIAPVTYNWLVSHARPDGMAGRVMDAKVPA